MTLVIHPLRPMRKESGRGTHWCQCTSEHGGMQRHATLKATIVGYPAGYLCGSCAKQWQAWWDNYLNERQKEEAA
jgi:hypothetical protein